MKYPGYGKMSCLFMNTNARSVVLFRKNSAETTLPYKWGMELREVLR